MQPTPTEKFVLGYAGAVTAAVGISVGLTKLIRKADHLPPATRLLVQKFVPLPAVCEGGLPWTLGSGGDEGFQARPPHSTPA